MKILHFIYDHIGNPWVGGGGAVRCFEIYRRLAKKGHKITVISGNYPGAEDYETEGVKFKFLGSKRHYIISVFSYAFEAMNFLSKYASHYDIIVEDFAPWNPIFSFKYQIKKPVILQIHHKEGMNILKRYFILGFPFFIIESLYPKLYKNVVTVSEESKKKFSINAKVIPNGISNFFLEENLEKGRYIGYLGRIDIHNKGLDLLIDVFSDINFPLHIAGKGKDEKKLLEMIKQKRLNSKIRLIGFLNEKQKVDFIKNAIFFVMPSRYEGQGIVALEVASLGKPVIVSNIPELKYVIENGFGISFNINNKKELKNAIEDLLQDEELLYNMGCRGRLYAKQFTWDAIAQQYEKYLSEVCIQSIRI